MIIKRKSRYVLVESSAPLTDSDFNELSTKLASLLGSFGQLDSNPKVVHRSENNTFVIRTNRGFERNIVLALSFVKKLGGRGVGLYSLKTSGTVRTLAPGSKRPAKH